MKEGDLIKFINEKKQQKYGVILHDYKTYYHVRGIKPNKQYKLEKKQIVCIIGGMER